MAASSTAAQWHSQRARSMRQKNRSLVRACHETRSVRACVWIHVLFAFQIGIALLSGAMPWAAVVLLAATAGAFFAWGQHSLLHETVHRTVWGAERGPVRAWLIKLCTLTYPDLSLFAYYRWQHMAHHARLAGNATSEVLLAERIDADVLAVSEYYAVRTEPGAGAHARKPERFKRGLRKALVGLTALREYGINCVLFLTHIALLPHMRLRPEAYAHRNAARLARARRSIAVQLGALLLVFVPLVLVSGPKAFVYLLLSFLFVKGFLCHPYLLFWLTEHKTTHHEDFCQPTSSVYHRSTDVLFWNLNRHVEHHDFPAVPGERLARLTDAFPEHYSALFAFSSLADAYRQFFSSDEAWVYGGQAVAEGSKVGPQVHETAPHGFIEIPAPSNQPPVASTSVTR